MDKHKYAAYCRQAVEEGCVLLENDGTLPFLKNERIAIFGREQFEYVKSGSGSGGKVNCPYVTDLNTCLRSTLPIDGEVDNFYRNFIAENPYNEGDGWIVPSVQKQPVLTDEFVCAAALRCEKALIVLSRVFGESIDVNNGKGGYLLTDEEENAVRLVTKYFRHTAVVINSGNLIDLSWVRRYKVGAVMLIWQGGQEGGAGAARLLTGEASPSGRLPMTAAEISAYSVFPFGDLSRNIHFEDIYVGYRYFLSFCPEKIIYPFGYGLGYTYFSFSSAQCVFEKENAVIEVTVRNEGDCAGKEVVQVYFSAPQGRLGKAERELAAFCKTRTLAPKESQRIRVSFPISAMCAFDDSDVCGFGHAFVMEAGTYTVLLGKNARDCVEISEYVLPETVCIERTSDALHPQKSFMRLTRSGKAKVSGYDCAYSEDLPNPIPVTGDQGYLLRDVADGHCGLDDFLAQFTAEELSQLVKGEGWGSPKSRVSGTAAVIGGTTSLFQTHGVPIVSLCDGPSGPRTEDGKEYTCIPSGTLLASMWSTEPLGKIYRGFADEMKESGIDVILAPGVNIQRHPFGGRNFEYFSEDPLLAGVFAAAVARTFAENGVYATLKHFAVNGQEAGRDGEDEIVSERALREIYLKPFEIAVKSGEVSCIMTSYNRINGVSACANIGLTDYILRREWGYDGIVMSDWWARADKFTDGSFSSANISQMIRAQNDLYMVVPDATADRDDLMTELKEGGLSPAELQRSARRIFRFIMRTQSFKGAAVADDQTRCDFFRRYAVLENIFVPECSGKYLLEVCYEANGSGLEQFSVPVMLEERQGAVFSAKSTSDGRAGFIVSLKAHQPVRFASAAVNVKEVFLYESDRT